MRQFFSAQSGDGRLTVAFSGEIHVGGALPSGVAAEGGAALIASAMAPATAGQPAIPDFSGLWMRTSPGYDYVGKVTAIPVAVKPDF